MNEHAHEPREDRVLINGPIQLKMSELYKFSASIVVMTFIGTVAYITLQRDINDNKEDILAATSSNAASIMQLSQNTSEAIRRVSEVVNTREQYIPRLIALEAEVARVNERNMSAAREFAERAAFQIQAENRVTQQRLDNIVERLTRIEDIVRPVPRPQRFPPEE